MQPVEQHCIGKSDPRYAAIDAASFTSKNLYNLANYHVRQVFIFQHSYLSYPEVFHLVKKTDVYKAELQSHLSTEMYTSHRIERLTNKRTRRIDHYLHTASKRIIDLLVAEGIGTLVSRRIKADINGSYKIMRKAAPKAFSKGVEGVAVHPRRLPVRTKVRAFTLSFVDTVVQ